MTKIKKKEFHLITFFSEDKASKNQNQNLFPRVSIDMKEISNKTKEKIILHKTN